jgi:hypothetical protein
LHEVPKTGRGQEKSEPTHEESTVGDVILGVTQRAPADSEQEHRHGKIEGTQQVRRHGAEACGEPAVDTEPHSGGDDDRECDEEEAEPIPAMDVVKIARPVAYTSSRSPDRMGDSEPQRTQRTAKAGDGARDGPGATAGRAASR